MSEQQADWDQCGQGDPPARAGRRRVPCCGGPGRGRAAQMGGVRVRCDRHPVLAEHTADRRDTEHLVVGVDERAHHGNRGSSSRAKKLEAANRTSLARLSSRASACHAFSCAASLVVVRAHRPLSTTTSCPRPSPPRPAAAPAHATRSDTSSVLARPHRSVESDPVPDPGRFNAGTGGPPSVNYLMIEPIRPYGFATPRVDRQWKRVR